MRKDSSIFKLLVIRILEYTIPNLQYNKKYKFCQTMDNQKKLQALLNASTSQLPVSPSQLSQILQLINTRVDMPKHAINFISKRMALKNKRTIINIFTILEYLGYQCELGLYSQISTKEFLFKISGLLMNKEVDQEVKSKIMETIFCWEELFRPHEDLLPLFFQFYAGMLRNGFDIPNNYKSPFRPAQLKQYKKPQQSQKAGSKPTQKKQSNLQKPSITQKKTFEQIREKLILTNQVIDNAHPADNVKQNQVLLQLIEQIKDCEKKVNKTINENPNQTIMELALAANDDIFITFRRFKDLQRNKKPEPFILTQLASDVMKQQEMRKTQSLNNSQKIQKSSQPQPSKQPQPKTLESILDLEQPQQKKIEPKASIKKQQNIFDLIQSQPPTAKKQQSKDIFDLIGDSQPVQQPTQPPAMNFDLLQQQQSVNYGSNSNQNPVIATNLSNFGNFDDLLKTANYQGIPAPSGNGISLNASDFATQADIKYEKKSAIDKLDEMTSHFLNK